MAALAVVVVAGLLSGRADAANVDLTGTTPLGVLRAGGLLFFAFAGYARIATLGEEVVDPARTIPRAVPRALGAVLAIYVTVAVTALLVAGPGRLAEAAAPLAAVLSAAGAEGLQPVVRGGAAVASLGVLLSLLAGWSRTAFAMADDGHLPRTFAAVSPRTRVPHHAALLVAVVVGGVVAVADLRGAIGFSSFGVLTYYGIANASAWTLPARQRLWTLPARQRLWCRAYPALGVAGCALLALSLPVEAVLGGLGLLAGGALVYRVRAPRGGADRGR